ncbi:hypothetical protein M0802_007094 [Mischocyttarus mexicanus]|nr:hypothetical protein M0802_007094 [Mischocyttarus mexicanus]
MGLAVTYTYSLELETDSGQILCIRGVRLELIANVCFDWWILGRMFVREYTSQFAYPRHSYRLRQPQTEKGTMVLTFVTLIINDE